MEQANLTREELFEEVWNNPLTTLAKKYAISDVGLRKICIKWNIPLPKAGHWSKAKHGKAPKKPRLPMWKPGDVKIKINLRKEGKVKPKNPYLALVKEIEESGICLEIEQDFRKVDPIIRRTRKFLESKYNYNSNNEKYYQLKDESMSVSTGKEQQNRALLIMDRLIKCLKERGHQVFVRERQGYVRIENEEIDFRIREKQNTNDVKDDRGWNTREYSYSGKLVFQIEYGWKCKEWTEQKTPFEQQIAKLVAGIEIRAAEKKQRRKELEQYKKEQEEIRRLQDIEREIQQQEQQKTDGLFEEFEAWKKAKEMHQFIQEIGQHRSKEWVDWALSKVPYVESRRKHVDSILPLKNGN